MSGQSLAFFGSDGIAVSANPRHQPEEFPMNTTTRAFTLLLCFGSTAVSPVMAQTGTPIGIGTASPAGKSAAASREAMKVFARIDLAQVEQPATKTDEVRGASQTQATSRQLLGAFSTNEMTRQPVIDLGIGADGMKKEVAALQQTLTELQQLQLQTKQAHRNASGTLYYPLHLLLQEHYEGLSKYADTIAECLLAVGASSDGRANTIVKTSGVPEIPGGFLDDAQILVWFTNAYKRVGEEVNAAIKTTEDIDPTTSNLLQEVEHEPHRVSRRPFGLGQAAKAWTSAWA